MGQPPLRSDVIVLELYHAEVGAAVLRGCREIVQGMGLDVTAGKAFGGGEGGGGLSGPRSPKWQMRG